MKYTLKDQDLYFILNDEDETPVAEFVSPQNGTLPQEGDRVTISLDGNEANNVDYMVVRRSFFYVKENCRNLAIVVVQPIREWLEELSAVQSDRWN